MAIERTFSIIKPDAVAKNVIGEIYSRFEKNGLRIVAARMLHLTLSLIHISEPTRLWSGSRMPSSA